jgi:putative chitinase
VIDRKTFFDAVRQNPFGGSLDQSQTDGMSHLLDVWEKHFAADNPNDGTMWLAYALATSFHETDQKMRPIEEYGKGGSRPYAAPAGPHGECYYGRGHVQLTWETNYKKAEAQLKGYGVDAELHRDPSCALDDQTSALVLFDGMIDGWFTGVGLPKYFNAAVGIEDPYNARRIVNGTDKANMIAGYYQAFKKALT